jgi:hypothetical protein
MAKRYIYPGLDSTMKLFLEIDDEIDYQKEMYFARLKSK